MSARSGLVEKILPTLFQAISGIFPWAGNIENMQMFFAYFCYFTGLGPLLLSTLGGDVCILGQARLLDSSDFNSNRTKHINVFKT